MDTIQSAAEGKVSDVLTSLRCDEHDESQVTVSRSEGRLQISGFGCCHAFETRVRATLKQLGATPAMDADQSDADGQRNPRAFISHSHADNDRIARPLDALLRERGLEVWLDERDLLPGTNLIDEIFSRGIAKSGAFVAILSANSIDSKWVHEELTNAVVQKIAGVVKVIIPVVLDGVAPPDFLKHTVWEVVNDLNLLPMHADRIAAAIFGRQPAPAAPPPAYAGVPVHHLPSLDTVDEQIFVAACCQIVDREPYHPVVGFPELLASSEKLGISYGHALESLAALEQHHYFENVLHSLGDRGIPAGGRISHHGMEMYLTHYRPKEYLEAKRGVLSEIVNNNGHSSRLMARQLGIHEAFVDHILIGLKYGGHLTAAHHSGGISIHPNRTIARVLRELENEA